MRLFTKALALLATVVALVGIGTSPALAATSYSVTESNDVGTQHARAWGSINWTGARSFNIGTAYLRDLACDNQPVFWYIDVDNRWTGTERFWHGGCNTQTSWSNVGASDTFNIRVIVIYVCRDTLFPECDAKSYRNPNVA
ncbi:hypothetical protein C8D88_105496 [Lentzea atacamensis]|uniref:Uncharacterized protein n=1 Tax=Lentzea atacamensis TaxID=531938 RepID=A0A316I176_9PSEU|nr:hypothetical protein [Lentzea atacamensis]PWK86447.1 hypothetical protein C8D88_105496 [Lentzea atacamensis]RAS59827.1 hypothetical protein C8D87_113133 [Lentzea atacamensis]